MLITAVGLVQATHGMLYGFGSIEWTRLGYSGFEIGFFWAFALAGEIMVFVWSRPLLARFGAHGLLIVGAVATIVRWSLFPFAPAAGFVGFALLQALHALTFGATYLGTQHLIARLVPERMTASAQGINAMAVGLLMAGTTSISGPIYAAWGINGFWAMVPLAALGLALLIAVRKYARA
jgi:PPP family 3-phenylpropionic acid transporter